MNKMEAVILLNSVPGVGPLRFKNLVGYFGSAAEVFKAPLSSLRLVEGLTEKIAENIISFRSHISFSTQECALAQQHGIQMITLEDEEYPPFLKMIHDAPPLLYVKGNAKVLRESSIAVVGTRTPTLYGWRMAKSFSKQLAELGVVIVSGLARGVDTAAHQATLDAHGKTIAVLGGGLLKMYPPENKRLSDLIAQEGAVVSEFPLQSNPDSGFFPRRNRIISGLSHGTLVIEGNIKSGALITAKLALEQGKEVFAVPGPIDSKLSEGPNFLIQQGAKFVSGIEDIVEEIAPLKKKYYSSDVEKKNRETKNVQLNLNLQEQVLLKHFSDSPIALDHLMFKSGLPVGEFSKMLLNLEIKGMVQSLPGKRYVRN